MSHIPFHPAPGFGELMPGDFVVPQNPITMAQNGVSRIARMGELMPSQFSVPQNPIVRNFQTNMQGMGTMGCAGIGCDSGGFTGSLAGGSLSGLGEIDWAGMAPDQWSKTTWYMIGGGILLMLLLFRPNKLGMRAELAEAKRSIYERYGRVGTKLRRGTAGAITGAAEAA